MVQDETGDSAFIILAGLVRVHLTHQQDRTRDIELARLSTFDFFGEMSLTTGEARTATVVAMCDCEFYVIRKRAFHSIIDNNEALVEALGRKLEERRSELAAGTQPVEDPTRPGAIQDDQQSFVSRIRRFFNLS